MVDNCSCDTLEQKITDILRDYDLIESDVGQITIVLLAMFNNYLNENIY